MTEQTWNEDQIETAVRQVLSAPESQQVMDKLTKKWASQEGEVYFHSYFEDDQPTGDYIIHYKGHPTPAHSRPLTPSEVPALRVAIEALEDILDNPGLYNPHLQIAETALAKMKELTNV